MLGEGLQTRNCAIRENPSGASDGTVCTSIFHLGLVLTRFYCTNLLL